MAVVHAMSAHHLHFQAFVVETDQDFRLLSEKKREWNLSNTIISAEGMCMPSAKPKLPRGFAYVRRHCVGCHVHSPPLPHEYFALM